ncbi:hypothetical protein [Streptomyces sp. NPDC051572]|uniref:hypothetical protein n=1 Tax=Streptomyces sp. NPDC051572 TaxID=3155802 RepID=UPI00344B132C
MLFTITTALILAGVILLRKKRVLAGYVTLASGWAVALFQSVVTDKSIGSSLIVLTIAITFTWYVKVKMEKHWAQGGSKK